MIGTRIGKLVVATVAAAGVTLPAAWYLRENILYTEQLEDELQRQIDVTKTHIQKTDDMLRQVTELNSRTSVMVQKNQETIDELAYYRSMYGVDRFDGMPAEHGSPRPTAPIHAQLMQYGLPSNANLWFYDQFIVSTNAERRVPNWVIQLIERGDHQDKPKTSDRKKSGFNNNTPHISMLNRANNKDYLGSGWSRGHMVPAGDMQMYNQLAMNQTFLLNSNIVPQDLQNNVNFWYRLEVFCKSDLAKHFDNVTVVSGPVYVPNLVEPIPGVVDTPGARFPKKKERRYLKHEVIGENNVAVPTHLFKVILAEKTLDQQLQDKEKSNGNGTEKSKLVVGAFMVPNEPIPSTAKLEDYEVSLATLEKLSGLEFFGRLRNSPYLHPDPLCEEFPCSVMTELDLETWNIPRRIGWSRSQKDLDLVLTDIQQKNIPTTPQISKALDDKLLEFEKEKEKEKSNQIKSI
ncbi:hypothetical protein DFA_09499 [Cavenderia fasciculata]|uniref:Uncharacterized protein n=1 Tax=Cavenderia fasciculata TaxID=261658 RepID=F4Q7T0_CACFS|nr:uncharacterized protein DFA_09499 [Cavenderia fasciculata]EGG15830.1 hypothetical protein DFA_09499 [Cavenderia fasciculata]|eukprot:XP_004352155.1 hypothetical protein DFA_09499 [Cavenderia fasciculata]